MERYKLRIIINTSNLQQGGALQIAASFIQEASHVDNIQFYVILGKATAKIINIDNFSNLNFYNIYIHPSDSLLSLFKFRKQLSNLEKNINPNAIITVFGPCYWKPKSPHIMGFANGYLLYEDTYFFTVWKEWLSLKYKLKKEYHRYLLKTEASYYWLETEDSKKRLSEFIKCNENKIIVASNNCGNFFRENVVEKHPLLPDKKKTRLLYISSYYPHKGFELIPPILDLLKQKGIDVEVIITINKYVSSKIFSNYTNIINLEAVNPKYCPYLYSTSDIIFIPTLLETFSATYPEAMYMQRPIITTDLPFARDICQDAALYFKPSSAEDASNKIIELIQRPNLVKDLIEKGNKRIQDFNLPAIRFKKILEKIININQ